MDPDAEKELKAAYRVFAQGHVEHADPGGVVALVVLSRVLGRLLEGVEGLGEAEENDDVDDAEGEHVSGDHAEDHGHKGPGQFDGSKNNDYFFI